MYDSSLVRARRAAVQAFTLVEVILAILIMSAIMTVLLYFYQRSVEVRQKVIEETEFLSISRMFFEQITSELRSARVVEDQFIGLEGTSNSIRFIATSLPLMDRWIASTNDPVILPPSTDLKRVSYSLLNGTNEFEPRGLDRYEELLTERSSSPATNATELFTGDPANAFATGGTNATSTMNTAQATDPMSMLTNDLQFARAPLTDKIRYLQFRYWAGTNWVDSWSGLELPAGVEITLGRDPMPAEQSVESSSSESPAAEVYPFEFYRRVVYLPNSSPPANRVSSSVPGMLEDNTVPATAPELELPIP